MNITWKKRNSKQRNRTRFGGNCSKEKTTTLVWSCAM